MTEEFKKTLIEYLIGNLPIEEGTNEEIFKSIDEIARFEWLDFIPTDLKYFRYEGLIQVQNSDIYVLYGGYTTIDDEVKGIITVLDNSFNPIKSFDQYDGGTNLRYIMSMIQIEDGTFVMTHCPDYPRLEPWTITTSEKRFVMLNNFTQMINGSYILRLQKSYVIPYTNLYCRKIFKDPNSAHYVLVNSMLRDANNPDYDQVSVIEFKINVGSDNEWFYAYTGAGWILSDSYVEFDERSNSFVEVVLSSSSNSSRAVGLWSKEFTAASNGYQYKNIHQFDYHPYIDTIGYNNQCVFLNKNELYFVQNNQRWGTTGTSMQKYIGLYYYNIQTEEFNIIYEKYLGDYDFCDLEAIFIAENNNDLYIQFNNNVDNENYLADYYFQRLENKQWNPIKISEQQSYSYSNRALYVNNNYNLLNLISYVTSMVESYWKIYNIKENYNSSKYNGQTYTNTNSLVADNVELYSNNSLVFARDLYNKSLNSNTTVATVEIPNTYLNDIDLTSKSLLSETNLNMVEDSNVVQKNIYETLFINFINTLQIIDRNDLQQQLFNSGASTYLNNQINDDEGYAKARFYKKIRITYGDESTKDVAYEFQNISDTSADIKFALYVDKLMLSAEILSNDLTTVYQTIDLTNLELNKIYSITQKVEVI